MRFLHCSDVHVTQDYAKVSMRQLGWRRSIAMLEHTLGGRASAYRQAKETLRQIAVDVGRHKADHLLVTGDLTAYATDEEFAGAREALGPAADSPATCSVIPGNHDCFTPNAVRTRRFESHFGHLLTSDMPEYRREGPFPFVHLKGEEVAVIGLLSARVPAFPGLAYGSIRRAQLSGLKDILDDPRLKDRAVLVMVHHGAFDQAGRRDALIHRLVDADALFKLLPGPRFSVLHGHIHERFHLDASATRPHMFCAGSSTRSGSEGYWVIDIADRRVAGASMHAPCVSSSC